MIKKEKFKWNENLIYITLTYLFINAAFFFHASTMNGGGSLVYIYIFPFFWLISIILIGIFTYSQRKILFEKRSKKTSILLLAFCTPIPYIILIQIFGIFFSLF
jgi:hypothetical protein